MIYFTSDLHLGHYNIIKHCNRPFTTIVQMNNTIITNWNNKITKNDEVYVLGDFAFVKDRKECESLLNSLNGKKYLIKGNHDKTHVTKANGWMSVDIYKKIRYDNYKFILMHYPIVEWQSKTHGSIMLHGHCHGTLNKKIIDLIEGTLIDVGVDYWNFEPVSIDIILKIHNKEISFYDHAGNVMPMHY